MNEQKIDLDQKSAGRRLSRASVLAAFISCALNCVVSQLSLRLAWGPAYGDPIDWLSLGLVLAGAGCGISGLVLGLKRKSPDTTIIAAIGLLLNLGILFVVIWYFAVIRPAAAS